MENYPACIELRCYITTILYVCSVIGKRRLKGKIVSPLEPKVVGGLYWGYSVRLARSLGAVFTECPYKDPYDLRIGTSERGDSVDQFKTDSFK